MPDEPTRSRKRPEWAAGLRQLYDSVVEEPLPDTFSDLLSQFDDAGGEASAADPSKKGDARSKGKGA